MSTFGDPVLRAASCFPLSTALVDDVTGRRVTFGELAEAVSMVGHALDRLPAPRGARVAILADSSSYYATLYLAVPAAGRVVVPLNTRYANEELEAACRDCEPDLLVTDRDPASLPHLAPLIVAMEQLFQPGRQPENDSGVLRAAEPGPEEGDPAAIFYTGGTTDRAKGVVLSHRNKLADALSFIVGLSLSDEDRWLVMSPMFHAAGSYNVLPCVWVGACQIFLPRFDAEAALRAIEHHRITMTFGVPSMLLALAEAQKRLQVDTSSLRLLGHGGAPITTALLHEVAGVFSGTEISGSYGATEMAPLAAIHRHQERVLDTPRARSAGIPVVGVNISVVDESGTPLPNGDIGELEVTGPNIMLGYWNKPEQTAEVLAGRRYRTGDIGFRDDDGYIYVVDRLKDMIITGGENVYGSEVEDVLTSHPAVLDSAVLGVPDDTWGELVTAVIVSRADVSEAELDGYCRARLARYKVPRRYVFTEGPLPRSAAGKLLKRELRSDPVDPPALPA